MKLGILPASARGFDCNQRVTAAMALAAYKHGFRFAVRYIRRAVPHDYDLTPKEVADILAAGLGLMLVQHVTPAPWRPTAALGATYGNTAALEALALVPRGCTVWLDLEGVDVGVPEDAVVAYCNAWYDEVFTAGFEPGLYVGDACGISGTALYRRLKFRRYWGAYNVNLDQWPAVRGFQMRQRVAMVVDYIPGITTEFDVDVIWPDKLGGTPVLLLPDAAPRAGRRHHSEEMRPHD